MAVVLGAGFEVGEKSEASVLEAKSDMLVADAGVVGEDMATLLG